MPNSVQHFLYQIFFVIEGGGKSSNMSEDVSSVCGGSSNICDDSSILCDDSSNICDDSSMVEVGGGCGPNGTGRFKGLVEGMVERMHEDNFHNKMDRVQVGHLVGVRKVFRLVIS